MDTSLFANVLDPANPSGIFRILGIILIWYIAGACWMILAKLKMNGLLLLTAILSIAWLIPASYVLLIYSLTDVAKLALVNIMSIGAILGFGLLIFSKPIENELRIMEKECDMMRDITLFQASDMRAQLALVKEKMRDRTEPASKDEVARSILKSVSPLVMLFFSKERSIVKWSLAAVNLGRVLAKHLRTQR
jgi:hypothetical protein